MSEAALDFEICRPVEDHCRLVMTWRNDPDSRAVSFHREEKEWETFWPEFQRDYFVDPALPPLFILESGYRVGFLRFRPVAHPRGLSGRVVDLSINLAPPARGRGLGPVALALAVTFLASRDVDTVVAEVRPDNAASHAVFRAAGFEVVGEVVKMVEDTGEEATVIRYVYEITPAFWRRGDVFVIAEAGSNWRMGDPERDRAMARALVDVAVDAGADAVKFQTYRPETVYAPGAGGSDYLAEAGIKQDIRDIFADLAMPYEMIGELAEYCRDKGIGFMSTPFSPADFAAVDPYVEIHKIASYEISHADLLDLAGRSGKPLILSTGASGPEDIAWAAERYRAAGGRDLCLLQCTAKYPAPPDSLNLAAIPWLRRRFAAAAGLSDHSRDPLAAPVVAVGLGARVIEKHFTLDRRLPGPDHAFALTPPELAQMVAAIRAAQPVAGDGVKTVLPAETELAAYARRGLQTLRPVAEGEVLREGDAFAVLRPGQQRLGLHPRHRERIEGKAAARDLAAGEGLQEGDWVE